MKNSDMLTTAKKKRIVVSWRLNSKPSKKSPRENIWTVRQTLSVIRDTMMIRKLILKLTFLPNRSPTIPPTNAPSPGWILK